MSGGPARAALFEPALTSSNQLAIDSWQAGSRLGPLPARAQAPNPGLKSLRPQHGADPVGYGQGGGFAGCDDPALHQHAVDLV